MCGVGWKVSSSLPISHFVVIGKVDFINQKNQKGKGLATRRMEYVGRRPKQALKLIGNSGTDGGKASFKSGLSKLSALYNKDGSENPMLTE